MILSFIVAGYSAGRIEGTLDPSSGRTFRTRLVNSCVRTRCCEYLGLFCDLGADALSRTLLDLALCHLSISFGAPAADARDWGLWSWVSDHFVVNSRRIQGASTEITAAMAAT